MGLPRRSYERFEAGEGRLNFSRVEAFAKATQSDPYAILAAIWTGAPALAWRCADNKLVTIWLMALQDFDQGSGEAIRQLDAHTLMSAFEEVFEKLTAIAALRQAAAEAWLGDGGDVGEGGEKAG